MIEATLTIKANKEGKRKRVRVIRVTFESKAEFFRWARQNKRRGTIRYKDWNL